MKNELVPAEKSLKAFLKLLLVLSVITVFFHFFPRLTPAFLEAVVTNAYAVVSNGSILQVFLIILLLALAIGDVRRFSPLIRLFKWVLALVIIWTSVAWIRGREATPGTSYLVELAVYAIVFVTLWILFRLAGIARYNLKYLSVQQFQTLQAMAEVCISGDTDLFKLQIEPQQVAANVDNYLSSFEGTNKWVMKLVLTAMEIYPLLSLNPLLSLMQPAARLDFLKQRFITDYAFQNFPAWYGDVVQAAIRITKQLCFMGYYSDPAVYESIGYVPFSKRPDVDERKRIFPVTPSPANDLVVLREADIQNNEISADVVIVGSGAGASILAYQLIHAGRKVLMVERGGFEKPCTFTEDEVDQVSRLYANGALQLSRDFRFQVFQGCCVGGSTTVNNAVCFETPEYILDKWINEMGINIDRERYLASMHAVYKLMRVSHTPTMTEDRFLNPGGRLFAEACAKMGYTKPDLDSVMANISGCLGSGYCNIGCAFGKKLSMLDTILPELQKSHPDSLRIIVNCEALSFNRNGTKIESLTAKFASGRKLSIKGNTFVSSAGAVSSSILLLKSKLGIANAGKKLAFNLGTQITAAYPQTVNSYDGLQISHFLKTGDHRFVMETWFNPPMFQSTAMPGWFDQHFNNMLHYSNMACTGVLVGTASNAEVKIAGLFGRDINYVPTEDDFNSLMTGLEKAAEIYLTGGAVRVMPNTFEYYEYKTIKELKENLRKNVKASPDISTGTGHPQGGNVMSNDASTGVVDEHFKVFGYDNLFVCDASVFPTSLGVNPQITVMSLAHYAGPIIASN
jgi:choline dehydrogenase-like flavoprotein